MDPQLSANLLNRWEDLTGRLNAVGDYLPGLLLRLALGLHFYFLGNARLATEGDSTSVVLPGGLSAPLSGWIEMLAGLLLLVGLMTRPVALLLLFVILATSAGENGLWSWMPVAGQGAGMHLLLAVALLPLLFQGAGRVSLDFLVGLPAGADPAPRSVADWGAFGLAALLLGAPLCLVSASAGAAFLIAGLALLAFQRWIVG